MYITILYWLVSAWNITYPSVSFYYNCILLLSMIIINVLVRGRKCHAACNNVSDMLEALDLLRRLVSSTLQTPLPQTFFSLLVEQDDVEVSFQLFKFCNAGKVHVGKQRGPNTHYAETTPKTHQFTLESAVSLFNF